MDVHSLMNELSEIARRRGFALIVGYHQSDATRRWCWIAGMGPRANDEPTFVSEHVELHTALKNLYNQVAE